MIIWGWIKTYRELFCLYIYILSYTYYIYTHTWPWIKNHQLINHHLSANRSTANFCLSPNIDGGSPIIIQGGWLRCRLQRGHRTASADRVGRSDGWKGRSSWGVMKWHIGFIDLYIHTYIYIHYIYIHMHTMIYHIFLHIIYMSKDFFWCSMMICRRYGQFFHHPLRPGSVFAGAMAPPCAAQALQAELWDLGWQWKNPRESTWLVDIHLISIWYPFDIHLISILGWLSNKVLTVPRGFSNLWMIFQW